MLKQRLDRAAQNNQWVSVCLRGENNPVQGQIEKENGMYFICTNSGYRMFAENQVTFLYTGINDVLPR